MADDLTHSGVHWVEGVARTATANPPTPGAAVATVATANADATYGQPEADLINELKTQVNLILVRLRSTGIIAP